MTASRIIREAGGDPAQELKREWSDGGGEDRGPMKCCAPPCATAT